MKTLVLSTSTNETTKYSESILGLGLGEVVTLPYDIIDQSEQFLYGKIKDCAPDMIVYIGSRWGKQPSISTLCKINWKIAPSVHICSDAADPPWHDLLRSYHDKGAFSLQVAIDGSRNWPGASSGLTLLTPVEFDNFPEIPQPHQARGTVCGFAGNAGSGDLSERTKLLSALLKERLLALRIRSSLPYTYDSYCDYLSACRMSLNIAYSGTEQVFQVKGRVVETGLACACLLETAGAPTSEWFRPGIDYLEYKDAEHAARIIRRLENEPVETEAIALNLHKRIKMEHSPRQFWNAIFSKIGMREAA